LRFVQMMHAGLPIPSNLPPPVDSLLGMHQKATLFLSVVQNYVMPVLFGLLGACVFVLRTINQKIEAFTFTPGSLPRYRARLVLGAVAGPAIGWFFTADGKLLAVAPDGLTGAGLTSHLSQIALAFVAGYAVEILFSLLDKIILVFRDQGIGADEARSRRGAAMQGG
jgi:hypothetical protein